MGKGVGTINHYTCNLQKGIIIFELFFSTILTDKFMKQYLKLISKKFGFGILLVKKKYNNISF
jgi:ribosomal protein L16/L10AE